MPTAALYIELDWPDVRHSRWLEMLRFKNRILQMPEHKLPKAIWDWSIKEKLNTWSHDIKLITNYIGIKDDSKLSSIIDIDFAENKLKQLARNSWHLEAYRKPKLRTYIQIHDFEERQVILKANLDRHHRSLVSKLVSGILPLRLETGRYKGIDEDERFCQVCDTEVVENEEHFLFKCTKLKESRKRFMDELHTDFPELKDRPNLEVLSALISEKHIKRFARWLEEMYMERRAILYS